MKSILVASRLVLTLNLIAHSAGLSGASTVPSPAPFKKPLPDLGHTATMDPPSRARIHSAYAQLPLYFEANQGQAGASVKFSAAGPGFRLFLMSSEAVLVLRGEAVHLHLIGSNSHPRLEGRGPLLGKSNYFLGNDPAQWRTGVSHYSQVAYRNVYPGIDMIYQGNGGRLEYSFTVAPGADPGLIEMEFKGAGRVRLDRQGDLILRFKGGTEAAFKAPNLFQVLGGERVPVRGRFVLVGGGRVRFEVGDYVHSQELVIDPTLAYSTYLGGTVADRAFAIAVDSSGNSYITGATASNLFPGAAGKFQAANGGGASDVFVTKINAAGTAVVWSTYLGGAGVDQGNGIAVDALGNVYVIGSTTAGGFPTASPFQAANVGGTDAFLTAINPTGTALIYSTYLGGAGEEHGNGIAVTAAGISYITGDTTSAGFPASVGSFQFTIGGADDAFVASFSAAGARRYASFLGGTGGDKGNAITIDALGNAYVTGQAADAFPIFPAAPPSAAAFKLTISGAFDAFAAKVDPTGATLLYSTYIGGSGIDEGTAIALRDANIAYITGYTFSADFPKIGFATTGQTTIGTAPDAFVFKLHIGNGGGSSDGEYSTYLGASTDDRGMSIAVDAQGDAYVSGHTTSGDFPTVNPLPGQTVLGATGKAFVTEIGPTGGTQVFSTYLGGVTDQAAQGIALDSVNNIYLAGWTNSTDFPTAIPIQAANAGAFDAFATKISAPTPAAGGSNVTPGFSISPVTGPDAGGTQVIIYGSGFNDATGVTFAGVNAQSFHVDSDGQITALSPAHAAGPAVDVVISKLSGGVIAGNYTYFGIPVPGASGPGSYIYPSPANGPTATVAYTMAESGNAEIRVYNEIGDLVTKVVDAKAAGVQASTFDTARLAPGVYFYILNLNYNSGNSDKRKLKKFVVKH